jgi:hypothetical protein
MHAARIQTKIVASTMVLETSIKLRAIVNGIMIPVKNTTGLLLL